MHRLGAGDIAEQAGVDRSGGSIRIQGQRAGRLAPVGARIVDGGELHYADQAVERQRLMLRDSGDCYSKPICLTADDHCQQGGRVGVPALGLGAHRGRGDTVCSDRVGLSDTAGELARELQ